VATRRLKSTSSGFDKIPACDRQTHRQTDRQTDAHLAIASREKIRFRDLSQDRLVQQRQYMYFIGLAVWLSGNALAWIAVVALRQTRLVLGWVTVRGRVNHFGMQPAN